MATAPNAIAPTIPRPEPTLAPMDGGIPADKLKSKQATGTKL